MAVAFIPAYIEYLGMEAYGLVGFFGVMQTWLMLMDFGVSATITREMSRPTVSVDDVKRSWTIVRSAELFTLAVASLIFVTTWCAADWISTSWVNASSLPGEKIAHAIVLMGVVVGLRFFENIYRSVLLGCQRQVSLNVITCILAALRGLGAVGVLAFFSSDIEVFFYWQALASLLAVLVVGARAYLVLPKNDDHVGPSFSILRDLRKFSGGVFLITFLGFMLSQVDKLILSKVLSLADFSAYALAATIASYLRMSGGAIDQAVYPKYVEFYKANRPDLVSLYYHRATQLSVVLMGGMTVGLVFFGEPIFYAWLDSHAIASAVVPLFSILAIGMFLNGVLTNPYSLQLAHGWTGLLTRVNAALVLFFVPLLWFSVNKFGPLGAAVSWLVLNAFYMVLLVHLMHRRLLHGQKTRWYLHDVASPMAAALCAALLVRMIVPAGLGVLADVIVALLSIATIIGAAALGASHTRRFLIGLSRTAEWKNV